MLVNFHKKKQILMFDTILKTASQPPIDTHVKVAEYNTRIFFRYFNYFLSGVEKMHFICTCN